MFRTKQITSLNAQSGVTIVGLMIGSLLGIIVLLAAFSLHKFAFSTSLSSSRDANHDRYIANIFSFAQKSLYSIDFNALVYGYNDTPNIVAVNTGETRIIYWRLLNDRNEYECYGIRDQADSEIENIREVDVITVADRFDCDGLVNLTALSWERLGRLGRFETNQPVLDITTQDASCTPFGIGNATKENTLITLSISSSSKVNRGIEGSSMTANRLAFCVVNSKARNWTYGG